METVLGQSDFYLHKQAEKRLNRSRAHVLCTSALVAAEIITAFYTPVKQSKWSGRVRRRQVKHLVQLAVLCLRADANKEDFSSLPRVTTQRRMKGCSDDIRLDQTEPAEERTEERGIGKESVKKRGRRKRQSRRGGKSELKISVTSGM